MSKKFEPTSLAAMVSLTGTNAPARSDAEIQRIVDAERAWRSRSWLYRVVFRHRKPVERLTLAERIVYQTMQAAPFIESVMERALYGGPGRTIIGAHSPNEIPRGRMIEEKFTWRA